MRAAILALVIFLVAATAATADWVIEEGFEGGTIPAGWTIVDSDDDGRTWRALEHDYAHEGAWLAVTDCYESGGEDWLITPQVAVATGDTFAFYARAWYGTEDFEVRLSTQTTSINDFDYVLDTVIGATTTYIRYAYDLSAYAGENCYLAIRWQQDVFGMAVDDVKVGWGVYEATDVGMLSIEVPEPYQVIDTGSYPSGTIRNYGTAVITESFDVICEIADETRAVVYADTVTHVGTMAPEDTDVVAFATEWTPTAVGDYTVTMTTHLAGDTTPENDSAQSETEVVLHYGTGGPDAFSYRWIDSDEDGGPVYDWIEICESGRSAITYEAPYFYADDNMSPPLPIGFAFPFYGIDRTEMYVDTNGEILLAENTWFNHYPNPGWNSDGNMFNYVYPIPGYVEMPALIAAYWDDLMADEGVGDVYFQTFGTEPDRYCVIEWHDFRFRYGTWDTSTLTFEMILHEDGEIVFQYQDTGIGQTGSVCPHDDGRSATVAIQNDTGDLGLCYLREIIEGMSYIGVEPPGNLLHDELAISFYLGEDDQPPYIVHEEMGNSFDSTPKMTVTIWEASGLTSDLLHYNYGAGWQAIGHTSFEMPNIYHYVLPQIPAGVELSYYFEATDNSVAQNSGTLPAGAPGDVFSFRILPTSGVGTLLAYGGAQDQSGTELAEFTAGLDAADVVYDIYDWFEYENFRFSNKYDAIFIYGKSSGGGSQHDTLSVALMEYLDSGTNEEPRNLFFASDDFGYAQHGYPNDEPMAKFFSAYLRAGYIPIGHPAEPPFGGTDGIGGPDTWDYSYGSILGLSGSPIGSAGIELPVYSNSPDVIYNRACPSWYWDEVTNPDISSWGSFVFEDGPISGHAYARGNGAAIWLDNLIYKSFFITFDLSQFSNGADARMLIQDAVDWFGVPTGIDDPDDEAIAGGLTLSQNRPNPFNPVTTIAYSIAQPGHVTVEVYNISGQRTATLVDEHVLAGAHEVLWRGRGDDGEPVGSGIYFYRIRSGEFTSMKKMILLK
jgi:hypothetical protein